MCLRDSKSCCNHESYESYVFPTSTYMVGTAGTVGVLLALGPWLSRMRHPARFPLVMPLVVPRPVGGRSPGSPCSPLCHLSALAGLRIAGATRVLPCMSPHRLPRPPVVPGRGGGITETRRIQATFAKYLLKFHDFFLKLLIF